MIMKYILPSFLGKKEFIQFTMACKYTYECSKTYRAVWKKEIYQLAEKYDFEVDENSHNSFGCIEIDRNHTIQNQILYPVKNHSHNYRIFTLNGIGTCAALRDEWAHTNNTEYYEKINREDTLFTNPINHLKLVFWYDP